MMFRVLIGLFPFPYYLWCVVFYFKSLLIFVSRYRYDGAGEFWYCGYEPKNTIYMTCGRIHKIKYYAVEATNVNLYEPYPYVLNFELIELVYFSFVPKSLIHNRMDRYIPYHFFLFWKELANRFAAKEWTFSKKITKENKCDDKSIRVYV